mmetsp:Transcript_22602/g.10893  ORF Transcript_22602/g.10893 Transcript_22602/m.10893 type:complete len:108 (+) Transcript_22602:181-504(+)
MAESIVYKKSFIFAKRILKLYKYLTKEKREFILSKQLLRSGTSIGANLKEAEFAQSDKDFINKMSIALKEAAETEYWLKLLEDDFLQKDKMLISIIKSLKTNKTNNH